ncbi:MAG: DNA glycosylase [Anaerovoracaceae bacterium]
MSKIILEDVRDFNPEHIFECGQCFRWNKESDGSYTGAAFGKVINVFAAGKSITLTNTNVDEFESIWRDYFDFDTDYDAIKNEISRDDDIMKKAILSGYGIRILNQEIWETIASFIISANNNIPRIKGSIEALAKNYGQKIDRFMGKDYYTFPSPEVVAELTLDDLTICGLGYRAKYLIETAKKVVEDGIDKIKALADEDVPTEEAFEYVNKFSGVGPKVANCILLFSMKKKDAFPIDTWVKKVMHELYGIEEENTSAMEFFAIENFGKNAGIAQQYLFYYMRTGREAELRDQREKELKEKMAARELEPKKPKTDRKFSSFDREERPVKQYKRGPEFKPVERKK